MRYQLVVPEILRDQGQENYNLPAFEAYMNMESKENFLYQAKVTNYLVREIFQNLRIYETSNRYRTAKKSHGKENAFKEN